MHDIEDFLSHSVSYNYQLLVRFAESSIETRGGLYWIRGPGQSLGWLPAIDAI